MDSKTADQIHRMMEVARKKYNGEQLINDIAEAGGYDNLEIRDIGQAIVFCELLQQGIKTLDETELVNNRQDIIEAFMALGEFLRSLALVRPV